LARRRGRQSLGALRHPRDAGRQDPQPDESFPGDLVSTWPSPDRFDPQPTLAGELVRVRPLREADYDALYAVASDPLIWEQPPDHGRDEPEVFRRFFAEAMERGGALAVLDVVSGEMLGSSRYHGWDGDRSEVEIGWTF